MKKSKLIFATAALVGIAAGLYVLFRTLRNIFDDYVEEDLFDEDADLDFIDEDFEEEDVSPVKETKEEKSSKSTSKVRRGYIPIHLHKGEAAS